MSHKRPRVEAMTGVLLWSLLLAGCASTKLTSSWRDPQFSGTVHRVLVVGVTTDQSRRRLFEDTMAGELRSHGVDAVQGYSVLPPDVGQPTKEQLLVAVAQTRADSVLLVRVVANETRTEVSRPAPPPPVSYGDYYDWSWQNTYVGPEVYQYHVVTVQADLLDTTSGKMTWTGKTETVDPKDVPKEIKRFASVVAGDLAKKKLLPK
jgi:hypothetical protein